MKMRHLKKIKGLFNQNRLCFLVALLLCSLFQPVFVQGAATTPDPKPEETGILSEDFNSLRYSINQVNVAEMIARNRDNKLMEPILTILEDPDLSEDGVVSAIDQMSGSVRFNGIRMTMSSPWLSVMNRSRPIGQWENHIIAKSQKQKARERFLSRDGSVLLAQSAEQDEGKLKAALFAAESEIEEELEEGEYIVGSDFGGIPLRSGCLGKNSWNTWFTPVHASTRLGGKGETPNFHISRTGFMSGIEKGHCPCTNFGIAFGYTAPTLYQQGDKITSDDLLIGMYFRKKLKSDIYVNFWLGYGYQEYKMRRTVSIPTLDMGYRYEGEYDGNSFSGCIEISRPIYCRPFFVLRPLAALEYQHGRQSGFDEIGRGPFALSYDSMDYETMIARCGFATQLGAADGSSKMIIRGRIYYGRQLGGESYPEGKAHFMTAGPSSEISIRGMDANRNYMMLGMGGQVYLDPARSCQLFGDYDAFVTTNLTIHSVSLGLIQRF